MLEYGQLACMIKMRLVHDFRVFGDNSSQPDQTAKHFSEPISKLLTAAKTLKTHNLFCNSSREQESSQKIVVVIIVVVVVLSLIHISEPTRPY